MPTIPDRETEWMRPGTGGKIDYPAWPMYGKDFSGAIDGALSALRHLRYYYEKGGVEAERGFWISPSRCARFVGLPLSLVGPRLAASCLDSNCPAWPWSRTKQKGVLALAFLPDMLDDILYIPISSVADFLGVARVQFYQKLREVAKTEYVPFRGCHKRSRSIHLGRVLTMAWLRKTRALFGPIYSYEELLCLVGLSPTTIARISCGGLLSKNA